MPRNVWLQQLLEQYTPYFDITIYEDGSNDNHPLKATCVYHSRSEKYVLSKKAQLWAAETNEYLYIFSMERLTMDTYHDCCEQALELGMQLVQPHAEHMYSYITAIILCDEADTDALQALQQYKKSKNFKLSLHGWMEYRIAAVVTDMPNAIERTSIVANKSGKDVKTFLQNLATKLK